jgi:hypothetical protein
MKRPLLRIFTKQSNDACYAMVRRGAICYIFFENIATGDAAVSEIDNDSNEVVWGAEAIGEVVNRSSRQTFYMLQAGLLPAKKIGNTWVSTVRELRDAVTPRIGAE